LVKYFREDPWEGWDLLRGADPADADAGRDARHAAVSFGVTRTR